MDDRALMELASAMNAVTCAIDIKKSVQERNIGDPVSRRIQLRITVTLSAT